MNNTELLRHFANNLKNEIRTCIPAEVESFDPVKGTVNVKPLIQGIKIGSTRQVKLETGEVVVVDDYSIPSILNVPVQMIFFGNGKITFPIKQGLQGILSICDRDIRLFKESQIESVQGSLRRFNMNDAVFLPYLPKRAELTGYNNDAIEIKYDENLIQVNSEGINLIGNVNITGNLIVSGEATISEIPFTTHTHQYVPGTGTPTPTDPPL